MVVVPVYKCVPVNVNVPAPVLVSAPVVLVVAPDMVNTTLVGTSIVELVAAVSVKFLSVEAVDPVYFKVPPPKTKLAALLDAEPKLPEATPPLPMLPTLKAPALIVVTPV